MKLHLATRRPPVTLLAAATLFVLSLFALGSLYEYQQSPEVAAETQATEHVAPHSFFTIIALPDTQNYLAKHSDIFDSQIKWIIANKDEQNIVFVSHLGDVVDDAADENQWQTAQNVLSQLDGKVPYAIAAGNHDMEEDGSALFLNQYFPATKFEKYDWWGGSFQVDKAAPPTNQTKGIKNSYQKLSVGREKLLFLHLEYCPANEVLDWAGDIIKQYADRQVIISTHAYINGNAERRGVGHQKCSHNSEGLNDGENIWQKLVVAGGNKNIKLIMGGHFSNPHGGIQRTDVHEGHQVHQFLANYQRWQNGGNGYLRIVRFDTQQQTIEVKTYSPVLNTYLENEWNSFTLQM